MEYELIICLIPAVVPFKFCICTMAIELAQCMKRSRLKIPFSPGFTQVFFGAERPKWMLPLVKGHL